MKERERESQREVREERVPLYEQKDKITVKNKNPNYVERWVSCNDPADPDRVERFLKAGYEFAPGNTKVGDPTVEDLTSRSSAHVERYMGQGLKQVLLRIRRDWYEADQKAKAENVNDLEREMYAQAKEGRYGTLRKSTKVDTHFFDPEK